jgi:autotransporter family porin
VSFTRDAGTFAGKTLTVAGNYTGNGGTIAMNTVLAGDESATDKLVIKGNTSGNTLVTFTNVGGAGDQTVDGIEVIEVGGASDGTFTKPAKNYLRAGAYVYQLEKADG